MKYQRQQVSLHDFVVLWGAGLESWRSERHMSCNRADLQHLIVQLQAWGESRVMFHRTPGAPTTARTPATQPGTLQKKELKWGEHKKTLLLELERMGQEGWVVVYTDGPAKRVRGWMQVGYGVWHGPHNTRNFSAHVPAHERQSISRGELRGVLHAMFSRAVGEHMVIVLDSEYVFKGITIWMEKWKRHVWRTSTGEVGHRDLWEQIDLLRRMGGEQLQVRWVPSHLDVEGNEAADELAGKGRELHPNNPLPLSKRRRVTEWDALGLVPIRDVRPGSGSRGGLRGGGGPVVTREAPRHWKLGSPCVAQTERSNTVLTSVIRGWAGPWGVTVTSLVRMSVTVERGAEGRGGRVKRPERNQRERAPVALLDCFELCVTAPNGALLDRWDNVCRGSAA